MGLLDRLRHDRSSTTAEQPTESPAAMTVTAQLFSGDDDLEIVGEASYQNALWSICGGVEGDKIRHQTVAVLVPEPDNPYDPNAIAVHIDGHIVGYLAREVAQQYGPGLRSLMARCNGYVALRGVIVGGGYYPDGPGRLGVWLEHDPHDFGFEPNRGSTWSNPAGSTVPSGGTMRTGFTEAWLTDVEDDSYDLSWFNDLPDADRPAIAMLRDLLATDPDPIDRHFQFAELEARLYRCRDLYATALDEFDEACWRHDAEMETICAAFMAKWGKVPLLETYRQMAVRQQKQKDWEACRWWAERGLALYGYNAAREDAVEDLLKRRNRALAKLEAEHRGSHAAAVRTIDTAVAERSDVPPATTFATNSEIEDLVCNQCRGSFERVRVRGRKPLLCPACRSSTNDPQGAS
jgi:HIRAN domain